MKALVFIEPADVSHCHCFSTVMCSLLQLVDWFNCGYDPMLVQIYTHTTVLLLVWNMSGSTRVSRYQKGKTKKVKTNLDLLEQEIVSGSGICLAICNAYSLRPPAGDTWVHLP